MQAEGQESQHSYLRSVRFGSVRVRKEEELAQSKFREN